MRSVAIIGSGRVGSAVGFLLQRAGYPVTAVITRSKSTAEKAASFIGAGEPGEDVVRAAALAEVLIITTPDRSIRAVCEKISASGALRHGTIVVHMSGAQSLDQLDSARIGGGYRAVIHPLQSVATREQGVKNLAGSYFRVEADSKALETARDIVRALGGVELKMPKWTPDQASAALYHAGAVAASNYFVALVDFSLKFYEALGADKQEALRAVLPLIKGTLANIEKLGLPDALTGPIARGDSETVGRHLEAIRERVPQLLTLYRGLAKQTMSVANQMQTLTPKAAAELSRLIDENDQTQRGGQ